MGNCCRNRIEYLTDLEYKQRAELKIIERDRSGSCIGHTIVSFGLYRPTDQCSIFINILNTKFRASGCVLPGFDPRGECEKECQDSFSIVSKENNLFSILFDGHGKDGRRVSLFCRDFMLNYFHKNFSDFEQDPQAAIEEMVEMCDGDLAGSGIECNLSGTTAVILVINLLGIHVGSIGDSRAILATLPRDNGVKEYPAY